MTTWPTYFVCLGHWVNEQNRQIYGAEVKGDPAIRRAQLGFILVQFLLERGGIVTISAQFGDSRG